MKNYKTTLSILALFLISFASATLTEDLFSSQCTDLKIEINEHNSVVDFYFNPNSYEWDKFSVNYEIDNETNITLNNLYLSSLLDSLEFKIESNEYVEFTYFNIEEGSILQAIIDNILTMSDESFTTSDLNNNLTLVNSFFELDDLGIYQNLEKEDKHFIYEIDQGYEDVDIEELVNEAITNFNISQILSEVGLEVPFDTNFSIEVQGLDSVGSGQSELSLLIDDGNQTFTKQIGVNIEEPIEEENEDDDNGGSSGGSSSSNKPKQNETKPPYIFIPNNETKENETCGDSCELETIDLVDYEEQDKKQRRAEIMAGAVLTLFVAMVITIVYLIIKLIVKGIKKRLGR